jgi:hypothetical protein
MMKKEWKKMRTKNMKMSMKKTNKKYLVDLISSLKCKTQKMMSIPMKMWINLKILLLKRKIKSRVLKGLQILKKHKSKSLKASAASLSNKTMKTKTITPLPEMWRKTLTQVQMPVLWT